jgi:hypothetical protein
MKKIIITFAILLSTLTAQAQKLEAISMEELISSIEKTDFTFKEKGMVFGFETIQSCLFMAHDMAIFKNYCFPERNYPVRGYTIISKKFGVIDLYEEDMTSVIKRDVQITEFPEILSPYLTTPLPQHSLVELSGIIEKLYYQYNPVCWSTNYSFYSGSSDADCTSRAYDVIGLEAWIQETQLITGDQKLWSDLMDILNRKLIR